MLRKLTSRLALTGTTAAVLCAVTVAPAWAAKPSGGTSTSGIDVSSPQCGDSLPAGEAFAIVGVNGGLANDYNSCLGTQFTYALSSTGRTAQAPAQTYLNTGDAGNSVADWPSPAYPGAYATAHSTAEVADPSTGAATSYTTPSGDCAFTSGTSGAGANSPGCAYMYGYDMVAGISYATGTVQGDLGSFHDATGGQLYQQPVWLDVETGNSWQPATTVGWAMNVADLQGMVDALTDAAGSTAPAVGIYSTASQWNQITGTPTTVSSAGNLLGLPVWIPGARSEKGAVSNCTQQPFTGSGGTVSVTQWFGSTYDGDHSCS